MHVFICLKRTNKANWRKFVQSVSDILLVNQSMKTDYRYTKFNITFKKKSHLMIGWNQIININVRNCHTRT